MAKDADQTGSLRAGFLFWKNLIEANGDLWYIIGRHTVQDSHASLSLKK
jgi:hypothetical protein